MENKESVEYLRPTFTEKNVWKESNAGIALVLGLIMIFVLVTTILITDISLILGIALLAIFAMLYFIALILLLEPLKIREISQTMIRTVEKPIVKEIVVEKPIYMDVVRDVVVEKPVYIDVVRDVVRNVYVSSKSPIKIPRYNYLASLQTKKYHAKKCRFAKLIKRKYKVSNNSKSYFIKKKFKACNVCIEKFA